LVKKDDAVRLRIKEPSMTGLTGTTGATMQKNDRHALWIATFLDI